MQFLQCSEKHFYVTWFLNVVLHSVLVSTALICISILINSPTFPPPFHICIHTQTKFTVFQLILIQYERIWFCGIPVQKYKNCKGFRTPEQLPLLVWNKRQNNWHCTSHVHHYSIFPAQRKDSSQSRSDCTQLFPTFMDKIRGEVILNIPISSSRSPYSGSLQILTSTLAKKPDCLEDTGALTTLAGATGGQPAIHKHADYKYFKNMFCSENPFHLEHTYIDRHFCTYKRVICLRSTIGKAF